MVAIVEGAIADSTFLQHGRATQRRNTIASFTGPLERSFSHALDHTRLHIKAVATLCDAGHPPIKVSWLDVPKMPLKAILCGQCKT